MGFWFGYQKGREILEKLDVDGRIILSGYYRNRITDNGVILSGSGEKIGRVVNGTMTLRIRYSERYTLSMFRTKSFSRGTHLRDVTNRESPLCLSVDYELGKTSTI
jgi:hypothetical protein